MDGYEEDDELTVCQRWWLVLLFGIILAVILIAISFALFLWWVGALFTPLLQSLSVMHG